LPVGEDHRGDRVGELAGQVAAHHEALSNISRQAGVVVCSAVAVPRPAGAVVLEVDDDGRRVDPTAL
jgi:hypothetical protein